MPRPKEYVVTLSAGERARLSRVISRGTHPARMIARARILLELDEADGPASDRRVVAERVGVSESTVYLVAKRFTEVAGDVDVAIGRKKRLSPPVPAKVTGDVEAHLIAWACQVVCVSGWCLGFRGRARCVLGRRARVVLGLSSSS